MNLDNTDIKPVFIENEKYKTTCAECGKRQGFYRKVTDNYLCTKCKMSAKHKLITKTTAIRTYNVSSNELYRAYKENEIQCFCVQNPYGAHKPQMKLYFEYEIVDLATKLHKKVKSKNDNVEFEVEYC